MVPRRTPHRARARRRLLRHLTVALAALAAPGTALAADVTPPSVTVSGATGAWGNTPTVTVTATVEDAESGVATIEHRTSTDGGSVWSSPAVGDTVVVSAEGTTLVSFRASDNAGNLSAWSAATPGAGGSVRLDRTAPSAPGAVPDQVSGQVLWLDADDASTVTTSSGAVTRWADRSGLANDATQTTPANRPLYVTGAQNGRNLVRFSSGGTQWLSLPGLAPRTILVAGRKQAVTNQNVVIGASGVSDSYLAFGASSGLGNGTAQIGTGAALTPAASEAAWQLIGGAHDGTDVTAYRNGAAGTPAATGGATWTVDGIAVHPTAGFRLAGDLGEVVAFDRVLPTAERQLLEGYLAWRWGTQASLTPGHPYAAAAPGASGGSATWSSGVSRTVSVSGGSDALSGTAGYEHRTSTDGGVTWGSAQSGSSVLVDGEGETLVQFRVLDAAGNVSPWSPSAGAAAATVRLDRVAPTVAVSGATGAWSTAASVSVTATPSDASSGVQATRYRTSTNGGTTWSAPLTGTSVSVSAEGETLVQFQATDVAGNSSAYTSATSGGTGSVRLDRTAPATAPAVSGATGTWTGAASVAVTATGGTDTGSGVQGHQYRTSTDGGTTWTSPEGGSGVAVTAEGETLVQFRAVDAVGNTGPWSTSSPAGTGSVRIDRTPPTVPTATGGGATWTNAASVAVTASGGTDAASGVALYQWSSSTDGGSTWGAPQTGATATITAQGETLVRMRTVDAAGNASAWTASRQVRIDRTNPTVSVSGATGAWSAAATVTATASPSDGQSSVAQTEYRLSTDGGSSWSTPQAGTSVGITEEGTTLVQFRATDAAGNQSAWTAATPGAAGSVRIDRTAPSVLVSGADGAWRSGAAQLVTTSLGDAGSGVAATQLRTSDDGGDTWSAPGSGGSLTVTREGTTLVQFRATDAAGNTSAWTAATPGGAGSVRLDRTLPVPTLTGATGAWTGADVTVTPGGSDLGSGVAGHQVRTSTDGGASWGAPQSVGSLTITAEGVTLVQSRTTDVAGNTSAWTTASAAGTGSVRIDRTPPAVTVNGADGSWSNAASVTVTAAVTDAASGVGLQEHRTSPDGGATWSAATPGGTVAVTGEGETLVQFRATDIAGNTGPWSTASPGGTGSVRIDRAPPGAPLMIVAPDTSVARNSSAGAVTISTSRPPGDTRSTRVVVTQGGRMVHNGPFGTVRDADLADATTYTYEAVSYDALGNVSAANTAVITTPDRTPPAQPAAPDSDGGWPPRLAWPAAAGSSAYRVLRDGVVIAEPTGAGFTDPDARDVMPPVAPGGVASEPTATGVTVRWMPVADRGTPYRYQVVATDAAGNTTPSPEVVLESVAGDVRYEVAVDGSPQEVRVARAAAVAPASALSAEVALTPGHHDVTVTAVDAAGNRSEAARITARGPDPGPATLTARASTAFARPGQNVVFTASAPARATVRWRFPDGRVLPGARVERTFRPGSVDAEVTARMPDGQELQTRLVVVVDGAPPAIATRMTGRRLRVVPQDTTGLATLTARIGRGPARPVRSGWVSVPEGRHTVHLVATDGAGNVRRTTARVVVDTRGPSLTARTTARPGRATGRVTWAARDGASGVRGVRVGTGPFRNAGGGVAVPAGSVAVLVAADRHGNITRLAAPVPAPMRLTNLRDPGLQGRGDRLLPGGGTRFGVQAVVLHEARTRLVWAGALRASARDTGRFDPALRAAVMRFQTARGIREPAGRGALGPTTLRAMDRLVRWGGWGASAGRG